MDEPADERVAPGETGSAAVDERIRRTLATYEEVAERYADRHGDRSVVADDVAAFLSALDETGGAACSDESGGRRVLDVGCGPGWESATFAEHCLDVAALDLSPSFLDQATEVAPAASHVRGDMRALPFADDAFDGLWACASLLHVPREDVPVTLAEFRRVLGPGGVCALVLQLPAAGDSREGFDDDRHFERYTADELRAILSDAGFAVESIDPGDGWLRAVARNG